MIEVVTDIESFERSREDWNTLLKTSSCDTFFLTWEWLYTWWKAFGGKNDLFLLLYRDEQGLLKGIFPLYVKKGIVKELRFIGSGADISSEYLDFICAAGLEEKVINIFTDYLFDKKSLWDILCLTDINQESENIDCLKRYLISKGINVIVNEQRPFCPIIKFNNTNSWVDFLRSRNKSLRQNVNRWHKKVNEAFRVEFCSYNSLDSYGLFDKFIELHALRREQKNTVSRFANNDYLLFHRTLLPLISQNKWLHFNVLKLNSNIVAVKYNFLYRNKIYSYQGGWDSGFAKYDVAQVLFSYILQDSINHGIEEVDMLRGEEPHKISWATGLRKKYRVIIPNGKIGNLIFIRLKLKSACISTIKKLLPGNIKEVIERRIYK